MEKDEPFITFGRRAILRPAPKPTSEASTYIYNWWEHEQPGAQTSRTYAIPVVCPEGYEYTGEFRVPVDGEPYVALSGNVATHPAGTTPAVTPRVILRHKPKRKRLVFDVLVENAAPKRGQWFKTDHGSRVLECAPCDFECPRVLVLSAPRIEEIE